MCSSINHYLKSCKDSVNVEFNRLKPGKSQLGGKYIKETPPVEKDYIDLKIEVSEGKTRELIGEIKQEMQAGEARMRDLVGEIKQEMDHMKRDIDVRFASMDAILTGIPTKTWFVGFGVSLFVGMLAVIAFGFDRFESGLLSSQVFDARLERMDEKKDTNQKEITQLIKAINNKVDENHQKTLEIFEAIGITSEK